MTQAMLLCNTLQATEIRAEITQEASTDGGIRIAESLTRAGSCCIIAGALA
jgi:hypothetical protein